jgi:hypothetical protein
VEKLEILGLSAFGKHKKFLGE